MYTWIGWKLKKGSKTDILRVQSIKIKEAPDCAEACSNFTSLLPICTDRCCINRCIFVPLL
jgi:hypothetical protein